MADELILSARERAFESFKKLDKWEKDNTLFKFILRGFKYSPMPSTVQDKFLYKKVDELKNKT